MLHSFHAEKSVVEEAESVLDEDEWIERILSEVRIVKYPKR